jgi:Replication-relaxation
MPPSAKAGPSKRGLYRRSEDDDIFYHIGKFSFLTADELAVLSGRNVVSLRKRLRQLCLVGLLGRVEGGKQREEFFKEIICKKCGTVNKLALPDGKIRPKPNFHYLTEQGGAKAASLIDNPIAWRSKAESRVDHDRVITIIHLALDHAFGAALDDWRQQKQDVKTTVELDGELISFYPDAQATLGGEPIWIEYANSEPSSANGENDIVLKVRRYNQLMKEQRGKVLFIFRERAMVENFVNRIAQQFPYLWPHVTDLDSLTTRPTEKIFYAPKDFDIRPHALIE